MFGWYYRKVWSVAGVDTIAPHPLKLFSGAQFRFGTLSLLKQCAYVWDGVGVAFQAVLVLLGLHFDLQPDAVWIMEVEGLAIPPFDNLGDGVSNVPIR